MIDPDIAILIVSVTVNAALGALVWRQHQKSQSARLFLLMVLLVICWSIANFAIDTSAQSEVALFWTRSMYVCAIGFMYVFFLFARSFSSIPSMRIRMLAEAITFMAASAVVATLGTDLVFSEATVGEAGLISLGFGPLYLPINLFGIVLVAISIIHLGIKVRRAGRTVLRNQAILIITGWLTFLGLMIIFAAFLPYFIPALVNDSKITPLFSIIMVGCTAYSIVRHQFLDITLIIRRGLIYSMVLGTILGLYIALLLISAYLLGIASDTAAFLSGAVTVVIGIYTAPRIEAYFRKQTDRIFFKDVYEYSVALEELCEVLNTEVRIPYLIQQSLSALARILKPERIEFSYVKTGMRYRSNGSCVEEARGLPWPDDTGFIIPVCSKERILGQFLLWPKRSGDPYTAEDGSLLRTFASQSTVALEKAELYEQLKEYSDDLEVKVRDRTQHLEDLRASQRGFMDDISHALQTPLTVLISAMELVGKNVPSEQNRYVQLATRSMNELSRLIRNLLALARVDAVPEESTSAQFNISSLMQDIVGYVGIICTEQDILLTSDIASGALLHGNQIQIEEAVTNILSNAVRYTANCPVRTIHVSLVRTGASVEISIKDSGIGINPELVPHIFERFYRAQEKQGSGLGLAITKRIVDRHNGSVTVASILGTGTTMTLSFPTP